MDDTIRAFPPSDRPGAVAARLLPDGRELVVYPEIWGTARLVVGEPGRPWCDDAWQYPSNFHATLAMVIWDGDGEPVGWHRHPTSGRRRPDGDPDREYVRP